MQFRTIWCDACKGYVKLMIDPSNLFTYKSLCVCVCVCVCMQEFDLLARIVKSTVYYTYSWSIDQTLVVKVHVHTYSNVIIMH